MNWESLKTMKEVAELIGRPAHRIIHVCENEVVRPSVDATGRGSVRRFSREDAFRLTVALELQEAGISLPLIKPVMASLDNLMEIREIQEWRKRFHPFDLVSVIEKIGTQDKPVLAWLTPPGRIALVTPNFIVPSRPGIRVDLHMGISQLLWRGVSIVSNLTRAIAGL